MLFRRRGVPAGPVLLRRGWLPAGAPLSMHEMRVPEELAHSGLPPYVPAPEPIMVRVLVGGEQHNGQVLGWRGERVYVRYRSPAGNHLAWLAAGDVERV